MESTKPSFTCSVLTLFPEMFPGPLGHSLAGRALERGIWDLNVLNIRDFSEDKHASVDDKPFGGGTGMVMRPNVLGNAVEAALAPYNGKGKVVYPSPRGAMLTQKTVKDLLLEEHVVLICGRFEGIDQRIIDAYNAAEISMGDFILSGGEIAALAMMDACIRLLPGVIGKQSALAEESFGDHANYAGLLEYPHYTRPALWKGREVPEVLMSGNHAAIEEWRLAQAEEITQERRQDLWLRYQEKQRGCK